MPSPFDLVSTAILRDEYTPVLNRIAGATEETAQKINNLNIAANVVLGISGALVALDFNAVKVSGHLDAIGKSMAFIEGAQKAAFDTTYVDRFAQHSGQTYTHLMEAANAFTLRHMDLQRSLKEDVDLTAARPGTSLAETTNLLLMMSQDRSLGYALGSRGLARYGINTTELGKDVGVDLSGRTIAGKIHSEDAFKGLDIEMAKGGYSGLDRYFATHTLAGSISMVEDAWTRMEKAIGSSELKPVIADIGELASLLNKLATETNEHPLAGQFIFALGPIGLLTGALMKGTAAYEAYNAKVLQGQTSQQIAAKKQIASIQETEAARYTEIEQEDAAYVAEMQHMVDVQAKRAEVASAEAAAVEARQVRSEKLAAETAAVERFTEAEENQRAAVYDLIETEYALSAAIEKVSAAEQVAFMYEAAHYETIDEALEKSIAQRARVAQAERELADIVLQREYDETTAIMATAEARQAALEMYDAAKNAQIADNEAIVAANKAVEVNALKSARDIELAGEEAAARTSNAWAIAAEKMDFDFMATQTKAEAVMTTIAGAAVIAGEKIGASMTAAFNGLKSASTGAVALGKNLFYVYEVSNAIQDLGKSKQENLMMGEYYLNYTSFGKGVAGGMSHLVQSQMAAAEGRQGTEGFSDFFGNAAAVARQKNDKQAEAALDLLRPQAADLEKHWNAWSKSRMDNLASKIVAAVSGSDSTGFPDQSTGPLNFTPTAMDDNPATDKKAANSQWDISAAKLDAILTEYDIDKKRYAIHKGDIELRKEMAVLQKKYLDTSAQEMVVLEHHAKAIANKKGFEQEYLTTVQREDDLLTKRSGLQDDESKRKIDQIISKVYGDNGLTDDDLRGFGLSSMSIMKANAGYKKAVDRTSQPTFKIYLIVDGKTLDEKMIKVKQEAAEMGSDMAQRALLGVYEHGSNSGPF